jgi:GNAT superfamily N-acetyltransferase
MIEFRPFATIKDRYYIVHNHQIKGIIDYIINENDNTFFIQLLKVYEEYRRTGVGRDVVNYIKENYSDKTIYGDSLPKSVEFWTAMNVTFTGAPEYKTRRDDLIHFVL